jgi:23S rRNA (cytidine1920-2'-O)/16S rRNA (cytidine1409-2'-O)-methyltransferase
VAPDVQIEVRNFEKKYVSRGGYKLERAIDTFGLDLAGAVCIDVGASTGGFTDCLLQNGACKVYAVDVGYGQLAWSLRRDPRVTVLERTNARDLMRDDLAYTPSLIVGDLSFISLALVIPVLAGVAGPGSDLVLLVKPQFEAGPRDVGLGGVVRDPAVWRRAVERVIQACQGAGLGVQAVMPSPLPGPAGNVEFPLHAVKGAAARGPDVDGALAEAAEIGGSR